jgi:uncharacterized membrane protein
MNFEHPQILVLILLLFPFLKLWKEKNRFLTAIRSILLVLAIIFLAGPGWDLTEPGIDLIVVADRSASIGQQGRNLETELLQLLSGARTRDDRLALIGFGNSAAIETQPVAGPVSSRFDHQKSPNGSNISAALLLAGQLSSPRRQARILLLSDGLFTGQDPVSPEIIGSIANIPVWYRQIGRTNITDLAAVSIILPPGAARGAGFIIRYNIFSQNKTKAEIILKRKNLILIRKKIQLQQGMNTYFARDLVDQPGMHEYQLTVKAAHDSIEENNRCKALLQIHDQPMLLLVSSTGKKGLLYKILAAAQMPIDIMKAEDMNWSSAHLVPYQVVILENLPMRAIGQKGANALADAVKNGVCGLLVTGGQNSYGTGGYHKSPLDPILPVTMQLREEQRRGIMAMVTALDRSGSMAMTVEGGLSKMDLANSGVAEAIRLLSPLDQISVIAVDSAAHTIVPLSQADETEELVKTVLKIKSQGGGIFIHTAIKAAAKEIHKSSLPGRHIIIFTDAADSEEQEGAIESATLLQEENITTTVIGLGTPDDPDAEFLINLAAAGAGEIYFTNTPQELPRIFSQEVIRVARRGFIKENTETTILPDMARLQLSTKNKPPVLGGYNLSSLRPGASCAMMTNDDYKAPVVSFWQKEKGKIAAVTAEIDGPYSGQISQWEKTPDLMVNLIRFLRTDLSSQENAIAYSALIRGIADIKFEVDDNLASQFRAAPITAKLLPPPGIKPLVKKAYLSGSNQARFQIPLKQPGHYLPIIDLKEKGIIKAPAITLSYSPEFQHFKFEQGESVLKSLAIATGGKDLVRADEVFSGEEITASKSRYDLSTWLALLILFLFLIEIGEKRLSLSDFLFSRK